MTIYIITFIFLCFAFNLWKRRGASISSIMWTWYAVMYISSVLLVSFYNNWEISSDSKAYIYMAIILIILLIPFCVIDDNIIETLILPSDKWLKPTILILTIGSLFSALFYIPSAIKALSVGVNEISYIRDLIIATGENPFIRRSIFNTIASIFSTFYMIQIVFFFITIIKERKLNWKSYVILFSSTSYIFLVLSFMGRDCFVFWLLSFLFLYVFFSKFIGNSERRKIKKIFILMMSICIFIFIIITIGRFLSSSDSDFIYPFLDYMGQGPLFFPDIYNVGLIHNGGSGIFSLIIKNVDMNTINNNEVVFYMYGIRSNVFRTIVGSLYLNFGEYGTIIFSLVISVFVMLYAPRNKHNWDFSFIIIYVLYVMIMYQGVFYFKLYDNASNLYIILSFLMALIFKRIPKQKIVIKK